MVPKSAVLEGAVVAISERVWGSRSPQDPTSILRRGRLRLRTTWSTGMPRCASHVRGYISFTRHLTCIVEVQCVLIAFVLASTLKARRNQNLD